MSQRRKVYINDIEAGLIQLDENGYKFYYHNEYLEKENAEPVSLTLPLRSEAYTSNFLFPFFDGLIPEGWLLEIAEKNWKIDRNNRMEMLLTVCNDCIGNVSIVREKI